MEKPVVGRAKVEADGKLTKKPYQKPSFRCERVFETQALSCGKIVGVGQCRTHKTS